VPQREIIFKKSQVASLTVLYPLFFCRRKSRKNGFPTAAKGKPAVAILEDRHHLGLAFVINIIIDSTDKQEVIDTLMRHLAVPKNKWSRLLSELSQV
jgi:hypothetical protein